MVLNEPETSLHPTLLAPLARLISKVSETTQVIVVSHATALVEALGPEAVRVTLEKDFGETKVADSDSPLWDWPSR